MKKLCREKHLAKPLATLFFKLGSMISLFLYYISSFTELTKERKEEKVEIVNFLIL